MSKIHYFQRYSSVENTVTNNTLQLLARVYDYSRTAASKLLSELTGEDVYIGIEIVQQPKVGRAVPDGSILQRSFKILIEAKVDSPVDRDQLLRHASTFTADSQNILLLLTRDPERTEGDLAKSIRESYPDVRFKAVTFEDICNAVSGLFKEHEVTMAALAEDFIEYCNDTGLFDQSGVLLRIVPCGQSLAINKRHGIYFHPSDRGYTRHAYVGIYAQKSVQALIAVESIFDVEVHGGRLMKTWVEGDNTDRFDARILMTIQEAKDICGYDIVSGHRFWCGPVVETDFRKSSSGGIQGARFVNLRVLLGAFTDQDDVARRLSGLTWQ